VGSKGGDMLNKGQPKYTQQSNSRKNSLDSSESKGSGSGSKT
jgi:hypothetical protein